MRLRVLTTVTLAVLVVVFMMPGSANCQSGYDDVVYLKDGSVIRGIIIEQVPGVSIKLKTADGNVFVYKVDEIERFAKEASLGNAGRAPGQQIGSKKSPGVAFLLSLVLTGGGQFYNGEGGKGAMMLGLVILGYVLFVAFFPEDIWVEQVYFDGYYYYYDGYWEQDGTAGVAYAGLGLALVASIWSLIDAPMAASRINRENGWAKADEKPKLNLNFANLSKTRSISPGLKLSLSF